MDCRPTRPSISLHTHEDRYTRLRMIPWWNQERLKNARVMVVGAGALGNEIIKNLALLGVGNILIIDFDGIELSNLSRSVLYKEADEGHAKAHAAAAAASAINPDCRVHSINADITWQLGLGAFRWADVVIGGLDNREARLAVNRACWKVNRPWVDGATESFQGVARVFVPPDGPCYECTLSEQDFAQMNARNSCGFIAREAYRMGSIPTTPTTSAVIAGIQVQEAIKLLHTEAGIPGLVGKGFFFDGGSYDCFTIEYVRKDDCLSHETYGCIIETELSSDGNTLGDLIALARDRIGGEPVVDLPDEMVVELRCGACGSSRELFRLLKAVDVQEARCKNCGLAMMPEVVGQCNSGSAFVGIPLAELGFGVMDIVSLRSGDREVHMEVSGDRPSVFGDRP